MRTMAVLIFAGAIQSAAFPAAAQVCEQVLRIGAWNIQWLGNPKEGKRKPQAPADIASYISAGGAAILALSEISATSKVNLEGRNSTLDEAFSVLNSSGAKWEYRLFPKREGARAPDDQWVGIAWDGSKVSLQGGPWKLDVAVDLAREEQLRQKLTKPEPTTIVLSRWPYAAKFSAGQGKADFVFVPVHLKSNTDGEVAAEIRAYEIELILSGLQKLKTTHNDNDVIVLGDTNMLAGSEPGNSALRTAGMKDCNPKDLGTHISFIKGRKWAPFDRIFLTNDQPETAASCSATGAGKGLLDFKIVRPEQWNSGATPSQFKTKLSDHMMVTAGVCVTNDDD